MRCHRKIKRQYMKAFCKSLACNFILLLYFCACSFAGTYYVATTGSDSNDGSISSPWASLTHAISVAKPGDTILMRGGTYNTNEVWIRRGMGGANGQYLTIKNYPGEIPSVGGSSRIIISADYVRIEGLYFRLPYRISGSSDYVQIVGNTFYGSQPAYGAIEFYPDNGLIADNHIEITGGGGSTYHGIYLHYGKNNIVRNNYISGSSGYGIHVYDEIKSGDPPDLIKRYENIIIEKNIVTRSQSRAGIIISAGESPSKGIEIDGVVVRNNIITENYFGIAVRHYGTIRNIYILNNVLYNNNSDGIQINANNVDNVTIKNNILALNTQRHINVSNVNTLDVSHNLYYQPESIGSGTTDKSPVFGNPLFVDALGGDFHLSANSLAIDSGVDVGLPYYGAAPDIGALEFGDPVPVELISFQASVKDNTVLLTWHTASETNNLGFEIERSLNKKNFQKIAFISGHGTITSQQNYQFLDKTVKVGNYYYYRLKQLDINNNFKYSSIIEISMDVPGSLTLQQNYPNPFNPATEIGYSLPNNTYVKLSIFDVTGRHIKTLVQERQSAGTKTVKWPGTDERGNRVTGGLYIYRLQTERFTLSRKMLLLH